MDDVTIATAIANRLAAVTPPAGQRAIAQASYRLDVVTQYPYLAIFPPDEDIDWLTGGEMRSSSDWEIELYLDPSADLPNRMEAIYAWRTAIRTQLAGQISLGVAGVVWAFLVRLSAPELENDDRLLDGLRLTVRVLVEEGATVAA
jgi:hypothetical protein